MAISDKLQDLLDIKQDIKAAIENKGVDLTGVEFDGYAGKIDEIPLQKEEQTKTVSSPNFSSGNVVVTPDSGKVLTQVTVVKDTTNHIAGNIKKDITLYGVTGTYEGEGETLPTLNAPTISLSGNILTITPNVSNGAFNDAATYILYDLTDEETYELDSLQIDLSEIITTVGDHLLKVRANRANFISADSNQVTYTVSQEQWDTPTIQLNNSVVSTPIVSGVTKYKVYVDNVYVGYVDANGTYHDV